MPLWISHIRLVYPLYSPFYSDKNLKVYSLIGDYFVLLSFLIMDIMILLVRAVCLIFYFIVLLPNFSD